MARSPTSRPRTSSPTACKAAALQNAAGKYEYPNLKNISAAAAVVKKVPANNEMHIVAPPKSAKTAYPLSTFTYAIVPKTSPKASLITKLVTYAIGDGPEVRRGARLRSGARGRPDRREEHAQADQAGLSGTTWDVTSPSSRR